MQVVILAGGTGTRLKEMTELLPKALISIGGRPMVYHIMKSYAAHGFKDFVLALGYRQEAFKEYFAHLNEINNDAFIYKGRTMRYDETSMDLWDVVLSDTGLNTLKGGRLKRIEKYIRDDTFLMSYGDGLSDINFKDLLAFHKRHGKMVTITAVHPPPRFGEVHRRDDGLVESFTEKPQDTTRLINAGFYVFDRKIFDYLAPDEWCDLELGPLEMIANQGQMMAYHHKGFWGCCDTLNDLVKLQQMWEKGVVPWAT
ncbi:MAG: sugar phosphate nucleotidyltransferase [Methanoregula sp.]